MFNKISTTFSKKVNWTVNRCAKMASLNSRGMQRLKKLIQEVRPIELSRCTDPVRLKKISSQLSHWLSLEADAAYSWTFFTRLHFQTASSTEKRRRKSNSVGTEIPSLLQIFLPACYRLTRCCSPPHQHLSCRLAVHWWIQKTPTDAHCGHSVLLFSTRYSPARCRSSCRLPCAQLAIIRQFLWRGARGWWCASRKGEEGGQQHRSSEARSSDCVFLRSLSLSHALSHSVQCQKKEELILLCDMLSISECLSWKGFRSS